ncbi:hypothetical protein QVD17_17811 [Tagetes erecta]|uniref:C2H2-type domain-containing protein n=1 Tax=Tagetes erecta TaxID=13708 RepID=A0AAD8NUP0_TARER|nr:hypothetical protein QVD17_17811 [Tagetes erecta]
MEIKNPKGAAADLVSTNINTNGEESRCYTCTFCKRGFSNAQALGGHMNVHRRDRAARLQADDQHEEQSSSDHHHPHDEAEGSKRPWFLTQANNHKYSRNKKDDDDDVKSKKQSLLQLSLCIHPSSTSHHYDHSSNKLSSSPAEVDLELRLGMDTETASTNCVPYKRHDENLNTGSPR